jgi:hypothetical protein
MKVDLSKIDVTDFNQVEHQIAGDDVVWIYPKLEGVSWDATNIIYRSSIWRKSDGQLISPGFKKFFNWSESPGVTPPPNALTPHIQCVEKLDGSCLIVSKYKGQLITRTRRAWAKTMLNGDEIDIFIKRYPKAFDNPLLNAEDHSLIFEWLTPSNRIVIKHDFADIKLIGVIKHDDYSYFTQQQVDETAKNIDVKRPKYFSYSSLEELMQKVTDLNGEEGVCVYYGNGQHIRKVKSEWYKAVHNFRNAMNLKNIVELFLINNKPSYGEFCNLVMNQYTYEGLEMARPLISQICDAMAASTNIVNGMKRFVAAMKADTTKYPTRKLMAEHIVSAYGKTSRADIAFTILDGKEVSNTQYKKLLFQTLVT